MYYGKKKRKKAMAYLPNGSERKEDDPPKD